MANTQKKETHEEDEVSVATGAGAGDSVLHQESEELHSEVQHGAGDAHEKGGFPPFETEHFPSQIFWLVLCFVTLYLILSRIGLPRIANILETRQHKLSSDIETAKNLRTEADQMKISYEESLAQARQKAHEMANAARDEAKAEAETKRKAAEQKLNKKMAEAEQKITQLRDDAMSRVEDVAAEAAADIHQLLLGNAPTAGKLKSAVQNAMKG